MKTKYPLVPIGDVLDDQNDAVAVDPASSYESAGVLSFGRGLFHRGLLSGSDTTYRSLSRLHAGDLVYSRLFAWEGAVAVVPPEFHGMHVSHEFPTFRVREKLANRSYLDALCRWPTFHSLLAQQTKGLGLRRQRVHPEQFLAVKIPFPDIEEQTRIALRLKETRRGLDQVGKRIAIPESVKGLCPAVIDRIMARRRLPATTIGETIDLVSDIVHPGENPAPADMFVGLQHVESHTGRRLGALPLGDEKGRKFRFRPGDVLYGYLRPYLNKVWLADSHGLCSVDQYVLRPKSKTSGVLVSYLLRSRSVLDQVNALTHSLQLPRLRSGLLAKVAIPMVPDAEQESILLDLEGALRRMLDLADMVRHRNTRVDALWLSLLNHAFEGEL